jgi:hypothetical protein
VFMNESFALFLSMFRFFSLCSIQDYLTYIFIFLTVHWLAEVAMIPRASYDALP